MMDRSRLNAIVAHVRTPLYRDAYALVLSNVVTSGLGVLYWALAARILSPESLGVGSVLISTMLFLSSVTQLNARVALLRFVPVVGRRTRRFVVLCYASAGGSGLLMGLAFVATLAIWSAASPSLAFLNDPALAAWFVVSIVIWSFFNLQDGLLTGLGKAVLVPLENGMYSAAKLVLLVILGGWAADQRAIFLSWTVPTAVIVVVISVYAFGSLIPAHVRKTGDRVLSMSARKLRGFLGLDYAASLFTTMTATLLPVVVVALSGAAQGAYFYIAWVIITSLQLVPMYLAASLTVQVVSARESAGGEIRRTAVHMLRLLIPMSAAIVLFAPILLGIFGQRYADEGSTLLRVASLGIVPFAGNVLFMSVARVQGRGLVIVALQASVALLTLGMSVLLLPSVGIVGVGIAWSVANALVSVPVLIFGLRPVLIRPTSIGEFSSRGGGSAEQPSQMQ